MESGSFSRGREETTALASMVFVGNIHHDIEHLVRTAHLFTPFPPEMQDLAFLDRFHLYLPGWEIPKVKPEFLTNHYGFVVDYLAEFLHSARQETFASAVDSNYRLGSALNERDRKAVRKTVSAILKLLHPDGNWNKGELEEYLRLAMEMRRRVKEQLKRMGGVEFWNTSLSYSPLSGGVEQVVSTPEIREGGMMASEEQPPGSVLAVGWDSVIGRAVLFRFEAQLLRGTGKLHLTGAVGRMMKEAAATAFDYLKSQAKDLVPERKFDDKDVHVQVIDLMRATEGRQTGLSFFVAILSAAANKRCIPDRVATGDVSIHGDALPLENLAECVLLARENGAKKLILPRQAKSIIHTVPEPILEGLTLSYCDNASQCFDLFLS
jgi:ATP-dependent Lon protease